MRAVSMGVYPIQKINSQVVDKDDVSNEDTTNSTLCSTKAYQFY